jgi:WD40 repeat protein
MVQQIWDQKTYKLKMDLPGHTDEVYCVDFVADKIVSGGRDRTVKMYVFFHQWIQYFLRYSVLILLFQMEEPNSSCWSLFFLFTI